LAAAGWVTLARAQLTMLSTAHTKTGAMASQSLRLRSASARVVVMAGRYRKGLRMQTGWAGCGARRDDTPGTSTRHARLEIGIQRMTRFNNTVSKIEARTENRIIIRQPAAPPTGRMFNETSCIDITHQEGALSRKSNPNICLS
jgi:hypothetical protein